MITSKLTRKAQTTLPRAVRDALRLRPGNEVAYVIEGPGLLWVLMITSAANRPWPGDVVIGDAGAVGLPAPSVIRTAKIATVDAALVDRLGSRGPAERKSVENTLDQRFAQFRNSRP